MKHIALFSGRRRVAAWRLWILADVEEVRAVIGRLPGRPQISAGGQTRLPGLSNPSRCAVDEQDPLVRQKVSSSLTVEHHMPQSRFAWMWRAYPFAADETACAKCPSGSSTPCGSCSVLC